MTVTDPPPPAHETKTFFEEVVEAAPDPLIVIDAGGRIVMINQRMVDVFGYEREELRDKTIEHLVPERFRKRHGEHRAKYVKAPRVRPMGQATTHLLGLKKDGTEVPVDISLSPLVAAGAKFTIAILRDVSHRVMVEQRLRYMGTHDTLTGLYNRAFFDEELARLDRGRSTVGVVVADLDSLKLVNDRYGHARGDELIQRAAAALSGALRAEDIVARLGGDEFGVLVPNATDADLARITARIRSNTLARARDGAALPLSMSLGATTGTPGNLRAALAAADEAMYAEKRSRSDGKVFQGDLTQVGLPSVLSFLELEQTTGELHLLGQRAARIRLRAGRPIRVSVDGIDAVGGRKEHVSRLLDLLDWTKGHFELVRGDDDAVQDEIGDSVTAILLEHARLKDEAGPRSVEPRSGR